MEPGVPFALLGAVQLLLIAAWCALAGTAIALRRGRVATILVVLGALVLAAVEVRTALRFGQLRSDDLAVGRAAGALLLAAGFGSGALRERPESRVPPAALGIIVPLAAAPGPAFLAGACTAIAAGVAARARRDVAGALVALGIGAAAAAAVSAPLADDSATGAFLVIALRGAAAVALLAGLVALARVSLLGKVVAAILAGVLAMAAAAVGVVGTNVVSSYQAQANSLVEEGTFDRLAALDRLGESAQVIAKIVARDPATTCPTPVHCNQVLNEVVSGGATSDFVVLVTKNGQARSLGGRAALRSTELLGVSRDPDVQDLFKSGVGINIQPIVKLRLVGAKPMLAVAAASLNSPKAPTYAVLYGVRVDNDYAASDISADTYGLSFLVDGKVVASNLTQRQRATLQQIADDAVVKAGLDPDGVTTPADGSRPTVHFAPVGDNQDLVLGVIAVSREASASLAAQRSALTSLLITALLATALVGGLALLLGRRTVDPVRRLTAAAARVSAGDLHATADVTSADEVGTLSRTFDRMTSSLARLTGDLRSSAARLETVLSSMSDGLVATDAHGRVTSINPAALQMVGLEREQDAVGRPLGDVVDVRDAAGSALAVPTLRLFDAVGEVHSAVDDDTVPVRVSLAPLATGDGVVLVLRDTTREREVERMKTEFLSNVSHELRTPLTPIRGYAEMLVAKPDSDAKKVAMFAGTIRDESIKMNRVVDLLVDVAAIEAGRVTVTPRPVTVKSLVDGRLDVWKAKAPERAKDFKKRVATGLPAVMVDPEWVGKALDELIDNAVKYTPRGTAITLTAALLDDSVRVGVRDAGPGIAEADQRILFTPFEQVDGSATRRVGGLGLGLSFVRRLADDTGLSLSFASAVGKGSEFSLDLPVSDQPVPTARRESPAKRRPAPARGRGR
ncbi:MAG: two-component system, OmpR family, phosphate regulon sensor histidine kinase PhoR [Actinomycetota bacterium]|jgi:two-component system sensor histidine kinase VicK|nr:two-component system, OmpR family, phosphate regulon sensor histidine kinase PhoR [Actinomycetota bacterium]